MKALPAGSKATSVTCLKRPSSAGSGGLGCFTGPVSSSDASCLRPKTIVTRPRGLNLTTMSDPLSVIQTLSLRSTRTVWPNDQAYRFLPISRRKFPSRSNSSNCAAAAAYAGPVVLPRERTKMLPFEFTATPVTSPRYRSFGSFSGSEASNGICGTASCANAGDASNMSNPTSRHFMTSSFCVVFRRGAPAIAAGEYSGRRRRRFAVKSRLSIGAAVLAKLLRPVAAEAIVHAQGVDPSGGRRGSAPLRGPGPVGEIRAARDRQSDQDDACTHDSGLFRRLKNFLPARRRFRPRRRLEHHHAGSYLLPLRLPPADSITRATSVTRPSTPNETARISGANPSGLKRHSQTSFPFIVFTSPGRPSRFLVSSRVVFPGRRRRTLSTVNTCSADRTTPLRSKAMT